MKNKEIESKINTAFSHTVPDVFDNILSRIDGSGALKLEPETGKGTAEHCENITPESVVKDANNKNATFTSKTADPEANDKTVKFRNKKPLIIGAILAGLAAAAAIIVPVGISGYNAANTVASVVSIDVNPSLEINVNKDRRVLSVVPLNKDAEEIVGNMNFKGTDLNVTINALLGAMISKGYLSEIANSILISVDNADPAEAAALQELLMSEIDKILKSDTFSGAIIGQTIKDDAELRLLAEQYGITMSKAQLIKEIIAQNPKLLFEDLVKLPINDLNLLKKKDTEGVTSIGDASDSAYVGLDAATLTALENAGLTKENVTDLRVGMEYENGALVYEVDFNSNGTEYEYDIDALTGKIVKGEREGQAKRETEVKKTDNISTDNNAGNKAEPVQAQQTPRPQTAAQTPAQPALISYDQAKNAALSHAGVGAGSIYDYEIELDYEGTPHYDIDFKSGNVEYSYEINAYNSAVIKCDREVDDDYYEAPKATQAAAPAPAQTKPAQTQPAAPADIGAAKAKSIAFGHAGVAASNVRDLDVGTDKENGRIIYEIDFKSGKYEYSYEIDGSNGNVLDHEKEEDD